jgi:hypothetical protein
MCADTVFFQHVVVECHLTLRFLSPFACVFAKVQKEQNYFVRFVAVVVDSVILTRISNLFFFCRTICWVPGGCNKMPTTTNGKGNTERKQKKYNTNSFVIRYG